MLQSDPDDADLDSRDPWCRDFEGHKKAHRFCSDHQVMWRANHLTWLTTWQLSARGGLHIFRYPKCFL